MEILVGIIVAAAAFVAFNWKKWQKERKAEAYIETLRGLIRDGEDAPSDIITEGFERYFLARATKTGTSRGEAESLHKTMFILAFQEYATTKDGPKTQDAYINRANYSWYKKPYQTPSATAQENTPNANIID